VLLLLLLLLLLIVGTVCENGQADECARITAQPASTARVLSLYSFDAPSVRADILLFMHT